MTWTGLQMRAAPPGSPIDSPRGPGGTRIHYATDGRDILFNQPDGWEVDQPWLWWTDGDGTFGNPPPGADGSDFLTSLPGGVPLHLDHLRHHRRPALGHLPDGYEKLPDPAVDSGPPGAPPRRPHRRPRHPRSRCGCRAVEFWTQWITAALWFGDGYLYVPVRDEAGAPKPPLWQLHPHDVTIHDGTYWVGDDVPLPSGSVIHLRGKAPYWNGHGKGVITEHGAALGLAATVATYASGVFTSGIPAGYLKSNQPNMTADQAQTLKSTWLAQHGGTKRSIAVLNATTEFHPIIHQPGGRPARLRPGSGRCATSPSPSGCPPTCWACPATPPPTPTWSRG